MSSPVRLLIKKLFLAPDDVRGMPYLLANSLGMMARQTIVGIRSKTCFTSPITDVASFTRSFVIPYSSSSSSSNSKYIFLHKLAVWMTEHGRTATCQQVANKQFTIHLWSKKRNSQREQNNKDEEESLSIAVVDGV